MMREFALLVLVCAVANLVGGDYGARKPSYIIQPAGPSKQHAWVGYGYSDYLPLSIPKPYFIPKWVPHMDPTYTAFWVPETPAPAGRHKAATAPAGTYKAAAAPAVRHKAAAAPAVRHKAAAAAPAGPPVKGFGPPKDNSVVAAPIESYASVSIPLTAVRSPLPPPPPPQKSLFDSPPPPQKPLFDFLPPPQKPLFDFLPPPQKPLFDSPIPQAPLPLETLPLVTITQDPLATFAPAPLGQPFELRAAPPAPVAINPPAPAFDPSFVSPKGEDVIDNSVVPASGTGGLP